MFAKRKSTQCDFLESPYPQSNDEPTVRNRCSIDELSVDPPQNGRLEPHPPRQTELDDSASHTRVSGVSPIVPLLHGSQVQREELPSMSSAPVHNLAPPSSTHSRLLLLVLHSPLAPLAAISTRAATRHRSPGEAGPTNTRSLKEASASYALRPRPPSVASLATRQVPRGPRLRAPPRIRKAKQISRAWRAIRRTSSLRARLDAARYA